MSHHASGPNFGFPRGDARLDMTDLYAFPKPGDLGKSILILNVHPSFRLDSPEPTTKEPFAPGALYEVKIDTNGDAIADICYSVQFASSEDGKQTATVRRIQGRTSRWGRRRRRSCRPGSTGLSRARSPGDKSRRLPFFLRLAQRSFLLRRNGQFQSNAVHGRRLLQRQDVCSIVLELPNSELGSNEVGIWARTVEKTAEGWVQADRGGRPLQAVFLVGEEREAYLSGEPANDDRFIGVFAHELEHSGGYTPEDAKAVARKLLPDILSYRPREPARFPHNGRTLTDDIVDLFFSIYANRNVTDKVGPHEDLLDEFPYLGPPHD